MVYGPINSSFMKEGYVLANHSDASINGSICIYLIENTVERACTPLKIPQKVTIAFSIFRQHHLDNDPK